MSAIARPQLRGLLKSALKRNAMVAAVFSLICSAAWKTSVCEPRKLRYTEFYKNYNVQKDFERMKTAGVFQSVNPDGSVGEGW